MSYTQLKADVTSWMHRTDLAVHMDMFSLLAEAEINSDLRVKEMEIILPVTFDARFTDLPDDYLVMRAIEVKGVPIPQVTPQQLDIATNNGHATGFAFAIHGGKIELAGAPDLTNTVDGELTYFGSVEAVSTALSGTTPVLDAYPLIYLSAMLIQANSYVQDDEQMAKWKEVYGKQVVTYNKTSQAGRYVLPTVR